MGTVPIFGVQNLQAVRKFWKWGLSPFSACRICEQRAESENGDCPHFLKASNLTPPPLNLPPW
jgi:hypothetical protein